MRFDKSHIEKHASWGGANGCEIDFLKSEAVANAVADKLYQNLRKEYSKSIERKSIKVSRSLAHAPTWRVKYMRVPLPSRPQFMSTNTRNSDAIKRAVKASYSSADLVDKWSS